MRTACLQDARIPRCILEARVIQVSHVLCGMRLC